MSVDKKVKEVEDKWKKVGALVEEVSTAIPADAWTRREFCARFGLTKEQARSRLLKMVEEGKIERGGKGDKIWYRLKEKK